MNLTNTFCLLALLALLSVAAAQTADDDEVNAAYPGYPHTFYSGTNMLTQDTWEPKSTLKLIFIMFSSLP